MIAVSIVTFNTDEKELTKCLDNVLLCKNISRVDIVDNSSQAYIRALIENRFPGVNYEPQANIGYGAANNISIRRSLANPDIKYHLVINSDIEFTPDILSGLIDEMEANTAIGLAMPAVVGLDGNPQSCCHPLPSPADLLLHRFAPKTMFRKWRESYDILPQKIGHPINVPYMHGCFMLFRVDALNIAGLFDERYFMYPEDIDITRRVHRHFQTMVFPQFTIVHAHRAASRHSLRMLLIHAWNMLKYFRKWGAFYDAERYKFNKALRQQLSE